MSHTQTGHAVTVDRGAVASQHDRHDVDEGDRRDGDPNADASGGSRGAKVTLVVASVVSFLTALEITIIAVALPEIEVAFPNAGRATISWIFTAYNIGVASLLLLSGWMAERLGRKRIFLIGLAVFTAGSLASGLAPSIGVLIAARVVQSIGGAMLVPSSLALILHSVARERRDIAVAVWAAAAGLAAAIGPTVGALLVEYLSWRSVFLINVPIGLATLVIARRQLVESRDPNIAARVDMVAVPTGAIGVGLVVFGIVAGSPLGWTHPVVVASLVLSALLIGVFAVRSARHPRPLFDPAVGRLPSFAVGSVAGVLFSAAFTGWLVLAPTFMSDVWGYSTMRAGLAVAPGPLAMAAVAASTGSLASRWGYRRVIAAGALVAMLATIWWAMFVGSEASYALSFLPGLLLLGAGVGVAFPMLTAASVRDIPSHRYATGAAGNTTVRMVAIALGIAVAFAIIGTDTSAAGSADFVTSWIVCGVLFAATAVVIWLAYPDAAPAPGVDEPAVQEGVEADEIVIDLRTPVAQGASLNASRLGS